MLAILNSKQVKEILAFLRERFGFGGKLDFVFLLSNKERLYLVTREISRVPLDKIRVNTLGMYFGEWRNGEMRPSIEGSQLIGKECTKNILKLDKENTNIWLQGYDLAITHPERGFLLITNGNDFLGCGRALEEKIQNFVPKNRRVNANA